MATGTAVTPALPPAYTNVGTAYFDVWKACPYTSFAMFDYLVKGPAGVNSPARLGSWTKLLRDMGTNKRNLAALGIKPEHVTAQIPDTLWKSNSGLCTSFSIRVAAESKVQRPFQYGDNVAAGHRAAWDRQENIAVIIDSSARRAIGFDDITKAREQTTSYKSAGKPKVLKWRWIENEQKTQQVLQTNTNNGPYQTFSAVPTKEDALAVCLRQLLPQSEMILMFRALNGTTANFFGKVSWNLSADLQRGGHTCTFSGQKGEDARYQVTVEFRQENREDPIAGEEAAFAFLYWLEQPIPGAGGRGMTRRTQFNDVWAIHWELWSAATEAWGGPKIFVDGRPVNPTGRRGAGGQTPGGAGAGQQSGRGSTSGLGRGGGSLGTPKTGPRQAGGSTSKPGFVDAAVAPVVGAFVKGTLTATPKAQKAA